MTVYFVSGGNRGLGLGFVKLWSERPNAVVLATARDPSKAKELHEWAKSHPNVHILKYEAAKREDAEALLAQIAPITSRIDVLLANAGKADAFYKVLDLPDDRWIEHYTVNALGPIRLVRALLPLVAKSTVRQILFMSSGAGSITDIPPFSFSAYGQSKAALNYSARALSVELKDEDFTVVCLNPGPVFTDMGNYSRGVMEKVDKTFSDDLWNRRGLTVEVSVGSLVKVIDGLSHASNGTFINYDGNELRW